MNKYPFKYNEETYTICVTNDDWWIEEEIEEMPERMMQAGTEFALEHGMEMPHWI